MFNKDKLPSIATLDSNIDTIYNFIPIGVTYDKKKCKKVTIGWYLNDEQLNKKAYETTPSASLLIAGGTGSGKSVIGKCIESHCMDYNYKIQTLTFNCFDNVAVVADTVDSLQRVMMKRFSYMEQYQVNHVNKLKEKEVDYYEIDGVFYAFDEFITFKVIDFNENAKRKHNLKEIYSVSAADFYEIVQKVDNKIDIVLFNGKKITSKDFKKVSQPYYPKAIMLIIDGLDNFMSSDDSKSVETIKNNLESLLRLGRAAACHTVIICQQPDILSGNSKDCIQTSILLGGFNDKLSNKTLGQDVSKNCKPMIKGRGFMINSGDLFEVQFFGRKTSPFSL